VSRALDRPGGSGTTCWPPTGRLHWLGGGAFYGGDGRDQGQYAGSHDNPNYRRGGVDENTLGIENLTLIKQRMVVVQMTFIQSTN